MSLPDPTQGLATPKTHRSTPTPGAYSAPDPCTVTPQLFRQQLLLPGSPTSAYRRLGRSEICKKSFIRGSRTLIEQAKSHVIIRLL